MRECLLHLSYPSPANVHALDYIDVTFVPFCHLHSCGLRYARSRAKKEGITAKKRKDKSALPPRTPPVTSSVGSVSDMASEPGASPSTALPSLPPPRNDYEDQHQRMHGPVPAGYGMGASQLSHPRSRNQVAYDTPSPSPPSSANTQSSFAYMPTAQSNSQSFTQASGYYGLAQHSIQSHNSPGHPSFYSSQVDASAGASPEISSRFVAVSAVPSYERDRGANRKDREYERGRERSMQSSSMPPTSFSTESRYGNMPKSMMAVDAEADIRRTRDRGDTVW
jgi:hypothetical protein